MKEKVVVSLSGGMDSATLMYFLLKEYDVFPLTISYGQRHSKEIMAARNLCEACGLIKRWKFVDLSILKSLLPSALTTDEKVPEGFYSDENMKQTVVPNRNMILLAIAGGYASSMGAKKLFYGAHSGDHEIYPDCRPVFINELKKALQLGTGWSNDGVQLEAPFSNLDKGVIAKLGLDLGVPFERSWTCYNGQDRPCLRCGSCTERTNAFLKAGNPDPLLTDVEWKQAVAYLKSVQPV